MRCPKSRFPIRIIVYEELEFIIYVSQGLTPSTASLVVVSTQHHHHTATFFQFLLSLFAVIPLIISSLTPSRCLYPCPGFCDYLWKLYPFVDPEFKTIIFQQLQCQEMLQWRGEGPGSVCVFNKLNVRQRGIFWMTPAVDCVMRLV